MPRVEVKHTLELTEDSFTNLLPEYLQAASNVFFTPIHIAQIAVRWLTEDGNKHILDIGAGIGKFCIVGAKNSNITFHGIEYRPSLVKLANKLIKKFETKNAVVQHANILQIDFSDYNAFYLFNPFHENIVPNKKLNNEVMLHDELYTIYLKYTERQLDKAKKGTLLVTYCGKNYEVPESFKKVRETEDKLLKLWLKK